MPFQCKLSVVLITYNHEKFILDCLDSILRQKLDVSWELVISEDGSTDNTRGIIVQYLKRKNINWKINKDQGNRGIPRNFADGILRASGEYIALMSGDDFFLGENTLQYLFTKLDTEEGDSFAMYCGNCIEWDSDQNRLSILNKSAVPVELRRKIFYFKNPITGLVIFRNVVRKFPDIFFKGRAEDRQFWMMLASTGRVKLDPFFVGRVYRRHKSSFTMSDITNRIQSLKNRIENNHLWADFFNDLDEPFFYEAQDIYRKKLILELVKEKKIKSALKEYRLLYEKGDDYYKLPLKRKLLFKALKHLSY